MSTLGITVVVAAVVMFAGWLVSLPIRNVTVVDSLWPSVFVVAAWSIQIWGPGEGGDGRSTLILAMITMWGATLATHLTRRNWGKPEDYRYDALRRRFQPFALWSVLVVFGLQGLLMTVVSLPVQAVLGDANPSGLGWLDYAGALMWATGWAFETISDGQLRCFLADESNRGKVMDRGLWRYSRHPNHFGDALMWWGIYVVSISAGGAWTFAGPLVMTLLLLRVSGVILVERRMGATRSGYAEYAARTSKFIPRPPRRVSN